MENGSRNRADLHSLAHRYVALLLRAERSEAIELVMRAAADAPLESIYIDLLQEAQYEVGRLWERNEISIAQEHYCTAVTQLALSLLYPRIAQGTKSRATFIGTCPEGELHEVGIRMVCDLFELRGWQSIYLGSSLSAAEIIRYVEQRRPEILGISTARDVNVERARELVRQLRARLRPGMKILVGGRPFVAQPELWREVGADGTGRNAAESVDAAVKLVGDAGSST